MARQALLSVARPSLMDRVKPENRRPLKQLAESMGFPHEAMSLLPTWLVPFTFYFGGAEEEAKSSVQYGVETILEAEFKKLGKPVGSIEDSTAVMNAMNELPEKYQLIMLDRMLDEVRENESKLSASEDQKFVDAAVPTENFWAQGLYEKMEEGLTREALGYGVYKVLLKDRNSAWTSWLINRLDQPGKILVAVGAGHLSGRDSLQTMLSAKGFEVERVQ
jgi:uncharacterized protein YbaP (TraB family)